MQKLYQRLFQWARFSHSRSYQHSLGRTVHTEVTVERQGITVLVRGAAGFDACPLCGQRLHPPLAKEVRLRLQQGSSSQEDPLHGTSS